MSFSNLHADCPSSNTTESKPVPPGLNYIIHPWQWGLLFASHCIFGGNGSVLNLRHVPKDTEAPYTCYAQPNDTKIFFSSFSQSLIFPIIINFFLEKVHRCIVCHSCVSHFLLFGTLPTVPPFIWFALRSGHLFCFQFSKIVFPIMKQFLKEEDSKPSLQPRLILQKCQWHGPWLLPPSDTRRVHVPVWYHIILLRFRNYLLD